jgi:hypothetical protein
METYGKLVKILIKQLREGSDPVSQKAIKEFDLQLTNPTYQIIHYESHLILREKGLIDANGQILQDIREVLEKEAVILSRVEKLRKEVEGDKKGKNNRPAKEAWKEWVSLQLIPDHKIKRNSIGYNELVRRKIFSDHDNNLKEEAGGVLLLDPTGKKKSIKETITECAAVFEALPEEKRLLLEL